MKKCPNCKSKVLKNANYCHNCGKALSQVAIEQTDNQDDASASAKIEYRQVNLSNRFVLFNAKKVDHIDSAFFFLVLFAIAFAVSHLALLIQSTINPELLIQMIQEETLTFATAIACVVYVLISFIWFFAVRSFDKKYAKSSIHFKTTYSKGSASSISLFAIFISLLKIAVSVLVWTGIIGYIENMFSAESIQTIASLLEGFGIDLSTFDFTQINEIMGTVAIGLRVLIYGIIALINIGPLLNSSVLQSNNKKSVKLLSSITKANAK